MQFVNFTEIMSRNVPLAQKEAEFSLAALMEIPIQFRATQELHLLRLLHFYMKLISSYQCSLLLCSVNWNNFLAARREGMTESFHCHLHRESGGQLLRPFFPAQPASVKTLQIHVHLLQFQPRVLQTG